MKNFKKVLSVIFAAVLICALFAGCSSGNKVDPAKDLENVKDNKKLVVGITDYEPIDYKDENGEWIGFDADLSKAVAEKLGVEVEFVVIKWENKFTELNSGTIDCIWNGMTVSDSVKTNCDISSSYATNSQVIVMKEENLSKYADSDSVKAAKFNIAVEKGSAGETEAKKLTDSTKIISLDGQSDALKEVKSGTADACIIDSTMANSMTKDGTDFDTLGYSISLTTEEYAAGFRKGSNLTEEVNKILSELKEDGTLDKLSQTYGVDLA